jgi:hypothetical protein
LSFLYKETNEAIMTETRMPAELEALAREYRGIPLWKSVPAGGRSPTDVFLALKNLCRQCFILESLEDPERWFVQALPAHRYE